VIEIHSTQRWFAAAQKVEYTDRRPFVSPLTPRGPEEVAQESLSFFLQKGLDWAYEREWRMVRKLSEASKILDVQNSRVHLYSIPAVTIAVVFIGARMPPERRAQLHELLLSNANRRIRLVQARLSPRKFVLEFSPVSRQKLRTQFDAKDSIPLEARTVKTPNLSFQRTEEKLAREWTPKGK